MSTIVGDPSLRLLARLKLRGAVRRQWRRLKTPKGLLFTLLGVGLFTVWIGSIVAPALLHGRPAPVDGATRLPVVRFAALALTLLSLSNSFSHRGLYLPVEEIQRLFAAPVTRADLVRYRLLATSARGLVGGLFIGVLAMRRMPSPGFALLGTFLGMLTLPVLNQLVAVLAGGFENRVLRRLASSRTWLLLLVAVVAAAIFGVAVGDLAPEELPVVGGLIGTDPGALLEHPVALAVTSPFEPWARMITAPSAGEFLRWFALCLAIWFVLFELTARMPIDYRELSLATSASVAARIRRARRGGGAAAARVSRRLVGLRVPWLFGRGPFGAIAWRKTGAILRKARGTLVVSMLVLAFVTMLATMISGGGEASPLIAPILIAVLGTLYLCAGLRFDFRDELERMEVIKAWPMKPWALFAAMLFPEVVLVSVLIAGAIAGHAVWTGTFDAGFVTIVAVVPVVVLCWVSLDNAAFLFAPVRVVPGQEGALQNAGRGLLMMLARGLMLGVLAVVGGGPAYFAYYCATELFGVSDGLAWKLGLAVFWLALAGVAAVLVGVGGVVLKRFDVASDRG